MRTFIGIVVAVLILGPFDLEILFSFFFFLFSFFFIFYDILIIGILIQDRRLCSFVFA